MSNFYKDNPDIEKTLDAVDLREVAELCEEGFRFAKEYDFAPTSPEDAIDSYKRALDVCGDIIGNRIAPILEQDPDFTKIITKKKFAWDQHDVLLRRLYERIRGRKYFQDYLDSGEDSLEEDARLWCRIYERELEDSTKLSDILEDLSIYWNDDLGYALGWCCRTLRELGQGETWRLPPLFQSELPGNESLESDRKFVVNLVRTACGHFDDFTNQVAELTPKWTRDRLCTTDLCLIACGMAEAKMAPQVSPRIIINEYVEISKYYSTPESSAFVNGLLDRLINQHE